MQRLQTRDQFQAVLAGRILAKTGHFALHRAALDVTDVTTTQSCISAMPLAAPLFAVRDVWMGALVPKRWARHAVRRNAIKRQIYAVSADYQASFEVAAHVVRVRAAFDPQRFTSAVSDALKVQVRQELHALFSRAVRFGAIEGTTARQPHV